MKTRGYEEFRCVADKCKMTCCQAWAIRVEQECYECWKKQPELEYLCDKVTYRREDGEDSYVMAMDQKKSCVMLTQQGLCDIVCKHGEQWLSETCKNFPRKKNEMKDEESQTIIAEEYSLSGACPEVLRYWLKAEGNTIWNQNYTTKEEYNYPLEYRIRNKMLDIFGKTNYSLVEKIQLNFSLLMECIECEWEEEADESLEWYTNEDNQKEIIQQWEKMKRNEQERFLELTQTFIDVIAFYRHEPMYEDYLEEIGQKLDHLDEKQIIEQYYEKWETQELLLKKYDGFFLKVIQSEIFADCISDDLELLIEAYQGILLEMQMTKIALFYGMSIEENHEEESFIHMYALMIRMIGHNTEGMAQYWEENFEDPILTKEYVKLIV